jgi:phage antirepressor YoqD-like protein
MDELKLFTEGKVTTGDGREFTRIIGAFGESSPNFLLWQAGELLGQETREITQNFERNKSNFEDGVDFIDLKSLITENDKTETVDITDFLKSVGITHHKYGRATQWLSFSFSGMMKLVKIATTKESWNIYDNFLEDYFKTKAENIIMKKTLKEEKDFLVEQKKFIIGSVIMEQDEIKRMELFRQNEKLSDRIKEIDIVLSNEELKKRIQEELQGDLAIAESFTNSNNCFDIGVFAKILDIPHMGRNNLYSWLREQGFLMHTNSPYQKYSEYFKILPVKNNYTGRDDNKTLIKAKGIKYIFEKLIKDGKVISKSINEVIEGLNGKAS